MMPKEKAEAYKIVFDDLMQVNMFKGIYDARHAEEEGVDDFMSGISTVMEYISYGVSEETYSEFNDLWWANIHESWKRAGRE